MRFDLTDMRLFLTVVERGSLTAGAQAMHLALASVSERIAGMESGARRAVAGAQPSRRARDARRALRSCGTRARSSARSSRCAANCAPTRRA